MPTATTQPARERARPRTKPHEERLLKLAAWILSQDVPLTRAEIYAAFPAHYRGDALARERMFSRDKEALRSLGFNLETAEVGGDEQVGYTIDAHSSTLAPLELSADESAAAWTAGLAALRLSAHPMSDELESALRKLVVGTRALPPRAAAVEDLASGAPGGDELLGKLVTAWEKRRRLRLGYWRVSSNEVVQREVDVYGWARRRGEWIFVGHCHLRRGVRIFYLSRVRAPVKQVTLSDEEAKARKRRGRKGDYDIPEAFDIRAWSRQQIRDYDVHAPVTATVRFRGSLAGIAHNLLPAADLARDGAGGKLARLDVRNLRGLVRQALAWGPEAEVTGPPEARAMAREILSSVAASPRRGTP